MLLAGYPVAALSRAERYDLEYVRFVQQKHLERFSLAHLRHFLRSRFGRSGTDRVVW